VSACILPRLPFVIVSGFSFVILSGFSFVILSGFSFVILSEAKDLNRRRILHLLRSDSATGESPNFHTIPHLSHAILGSLLQSERFSSVAATP